MTYPPTYVVTHLPIYLRSPLPTQATAHALGCVGVEEKGRIFLPKGASEAKVSLLSTYKSVELQFVPGDDCVEAEVAAGKFAKEDPRALYSKFGQLPGLCSRGTRGGGEGLASFLFYAPNLTRRACLCICFPPLPARTLQFHRATTGRS